MVEKNQELEVQIVSYGSEGQGVARVDNFVIFVPMALIDEVVKVHIIKVTKTFAVGKIIEIIKASPYRIEPKCSVYGKCGGCSLQHLEYYKTLSLKKNIVSDAMKKIAGLSNVNVKDVVPSSKEYNYRNKAAFPIFVNNGNVEVCMYRTLSHNPVCIETCEISDDFINKIVAIFEKFVNSNYALKDKLSLKHLVIRVVDKKVLVALVADKPIKNANLLYYNIKTGLNLPEDGLGLFWCKKNIDNNVILEGEIKHLLGVHNITSNILGINVEISPKSFFQVNIDIMEKIYRKVQSNINKNEIVVDAYSGAGLMSALLAQKAKEVYGIEIVPEATKNADALKRNNKISNLTNINGDMAVELPKLLSRVNKIDAMVLDPPRKGIENIVLETILKVLPEKIIYVSCNPATLARDISVLSSRYDLSEFEPYDMFPQTSHIETFALLSKKNI